MTYTPSRLSIAAPSARSSLSLSQNNYVPCARTSGSCPRPYAGYKSSDVHMSYDTDYRRISSDSQPYNEFQNHFVRKSQIKARQPLPQPNVKAIPIFKGLAYNKNTRTVVSNVDPEQTQQHWEKPMKTIFQTPAGARKLPPSSDAFQHHVPQIPIAGHSENRNAHFHNPSASSTLTHSRGSPRRAMSPLSTASQMGSCAAINTLHMSRVQSPDTILPVEQPSPSRRNVALRRPTIASVASDRVHNEHRHHHHSRPQSRNRSRAPSSCAGRRTRVPPLINVQPTSDDDLDDTGSILYLTGVQLTELPEEFGRLQNLELLSLENNKFKEVPFAVTKLRSLRTLYLNSNRLTRIHPSIRDLVNLRYLWLQRNRLKELPTSICCLANLRYLHMENNMIEVISEAIACVGRLKGLWISDNCLKSLPLNLAKVKTLEVLDVERNYLTVIPDKIKQLPRLREFSYSGNSTAQVNLKVLKNYASTIGKFMTQAKKGR
ncbi:Oidioi.mRNA.OKI2018_I69.XSR.g15994.t1.cds [Oikopleura dioica]|uniref:Oidioi.mRNA.OKI2018_I69.XSR.g15994.t1.cds n=1 Tax=Oikopleura dioica TaxID=34765 RepID=A0ABN7SJL2_OIKDI|nr:Oidioi.mRNA.OKI2018_I69.XSR.g15994.t1.cds [Oikopleura dioica]